MYSDFVVPVNKCCCSPARCGPSSACRYGRLLGRGFPIANPPFGPSSFAPGGGSSSNQTKSCALASGLTVGFACERIFVLILARCLSIRLLHPACSFSSLSTILACSGDRLLDQGRQRLIVIAADERLLDAGKIGIELVVFLVRDGIVFVAMAFGTTQRQAGQTWPKVLVRSTL